MRLQEYLTEQAHTLAADINEIGLGFNLLGGKWSGFVGSGEAKKQLDSRISQLGQETADVELDRSYIMALEVLKWAHSNGYKGNPKKIWWTARAGVLSKAVGQSVDPTKNPTDVLIQFSDGQFLGVSAKSTKSQGEIPFKNPGIKTIDKQLGLSMGKKADEITKQLVKELGLPASAGARKKFLRQKENEHIRQSTISKGFAIMTDIRDTLLHKLKSLNPKAAREHILTTWLNAVPTFPPYIKVTGHGSGKKLKATISNPLKNQKTVLLMNNDPEFEPVGVDSIGVSAGGQHIMKMRVKFESEKLASSIKFSGDPWR